MKLIYYPPGHNSSCEPVMSQLKTWVIHELSVSYTPVICELYGNSIPYYGHNLTDVFNSSCEWVIHQLCPLGSAISHIISHINSREMFELNFCLNYFLIFFFWNDPRSAFFWGVGHWTCMHTVMTLYNEGGNAWKSYKSSMAHLKNVLRREIQRAQS